MTKWLCCCVGSVLLCSFVVCKHRSYELMTNAPLGSMVHWMICQFEGEQIEAETVEMVKRM